jgi:hypothetical protein
VATETCKYCNETKEDYEFIVRYIKGKRIVNKVCRKCHRNRAKDGYRKGHKNTTISMLGVIATERTVPTANETERKPWREAPHPTRKPLRKAYTGGNVTVPDEEVKKYIRMYYDGTALMEIARRYNQNPVNLDAWITGRTRSRLLIEVEREMKRKKR